MATGDERCKGCYSYLEGGDLHCLAPAYFNGKKCPCITCLVKSICRSSNLDCLEYEEYIIHTGI